MNITTAEPTANVSVGDSYAMVLDKLGQPNIDSRTDNSRVLIYDKVELKLQDDAVVTIYDHR